MADSDYDYFLITQYKYSASNINDIGGPGFDSGWVGPEDNQTKVTISSTWHSPCSLPCSSSSSSPSSSNT